MMPAPLPQPISLTGQERALLNKIEFGPGGYYTTLNDAPVRLVRLLLKRDAIPKVRLKYLTDPKYFISNLKGSRLSNFRGRSMEEKIAHAHFGPYLRYLIFGPDLPSHTIEGFHRIVVDDNGTSGEVMDQLRRYARAESRRLGLPPSKARDEFFTLAIECGLDLTIAEIVRNAAGSAR